jgi:hypothetical protein
MIMVLREAYDLPEHISDKQIYDELAKKPFHRYNLTELREIARELERMNTQ